VNTELRKRRPLRVLIVSAYAEPHPGGVEVVVGQQAGTLAALGYEVTVVTSRCGADRGAPEGADGYTVVRVPAWNGLEDRRGVPVPVWSPSAVWQVFRLVRNADVVHVHDAYHWSSFLAAALTRVRRRPLFLTQHVAIVDHMAVVTLVQKLIYSSVGRLLWRWAVTVTVYNPIVAEFLAEYGVPGSKINLTFNGVDTSEFRPGQPGEVPLIRAKYGLKPELPVVLFVGRLVPKKGFHKLLEARSPSYQIVLAGPGKIPDQIPAGVTFLGPVSRQELKSLYQASDIFAFPAVGEMLTLAMQEAMSCGLPVVATDHEAYARYELDSSGVALVPPEPEILRSTFLAIIGDPARRERMGNYSRRLAVGRFDWLANAQHLAREYDRACGVL
jgi:D-inositol-3-phosphate glycosyltransferase